MVAVGATGLRSSAGLEQICSDCNEIDEHAGDAFSEPLTLCICKRQQHMRTDGSQPSCLSAKKTKRSTNDDCSIRKKQPNLKPKPSRLQILRPAKRPARASCRSWSFVRPTKKGENGVCFLKGQIAQPSSSLE